MEHIAKFVDDKERTKYLGHAWYADICVGDFIKKIEKLSDDAIFIIVGHHFSRKHRKS
jgi:phosphoglycerol transferase MdoB-like AlkP superfamily enzyme